MNLIWNKEEDVLTERQGLEVWGYRMCMKDRMRRFLVDVLDIHNKDVIEKSYWYFQHQALPEGAGTVQSGGTGGYLLLPDGRRDGRISLHDGRKADFG